MLKKLSREEIDILHISQIIERKKAILINLQLMAEEKTGNKQYTKDITDDMKKKYSMEGTVEICGKIFPRQPRLTCYFRGENKWYADGKASLYREKDCTKQKKYLNIYRKRMKWISEKLNKWENTENKAYPVCTGLVLHENGCPSEWMSFTTDFDEALFYACCQYEKGHWRPLNKKDIHEGHRTGVIYSACSDLTDFYEGSDEYGKMIPETGQPYIRTFSPYSFGMRMRPDDDLRSDPRFVCFVFHQNEELTQMIFEKMKEGKLLERKIKKDFNIIITNS